MNQAHLRLWIDALRSGKFKQTRGQLQRGNAFCCLGVACEAGGIPHDENGTGEKGGYTLIYNWLGLPQLHGLISNAYMRNDIEKQSFAEIADWLETFVEN